MKADTDGEEIWYRTFGGGGGDDGHNIIQTSDGGYLLVGKTTSFGAGGYDSYVIKTDTEGEEEWSRTYGTEVDEAFLSAVEVEDSYDVLAGLQGVFGFGGPDLMWLVKIDHEGEVVWERNYGDDQSDYRFYSMAMTFDGGFILGGYRGFDFFIVRSDSIGAVMWTDIIGGRPTDRCYSVVTTVDSGYAYAGETGLLDNRLDQMWLIKTAPDPVYENAVELVDPALLALFELLPPYPNPFNSATVITFSVPSRRSVELTVWDIQGRKVADLAGGIYKVGSHRVIWRGFGLSAGSYVVRLESGASVISSKVVHIK